MSDTRARLETGALVLALLLVFAFVASFVVGLMSRPDRAQVAEVPTATLPAQPPAKRGRVEVLNASGRQGLARAATLQLRDAGFDVVYFGTARVRRDSSVVLDRIGRRQVADAAAKALSIPAVKTERDSTLLLDATVLLGGDWLKRQAAQQQALETGWKARVKRWLGR